jgi:hypothetical protein
MKRKGILFRVGLDERERVPERHIRLSRNASDRSGQHGKRICRAGLAHYRKGHRIYSAPPLGSLRFGEWRIGR